MPHNSKLILVTLLLCHSPLKWAVGPLLLILLIIYKKHPPRKNLAIVAATLTALLAIGTLINLAHNQNYWGILLSALLLAPNVILIYLYAGRCSTEDTYTALKIFTIIQSATVLLQYIYIAMKIRALNIFAVDQSHGDLLAGTFMSFSTPLATTFAFCAVFFIWHFFKNNSKQDLGYCLASLTLIAATGAMSILITTAPIIIAYAVIKIFRTNLKPSTKFYIIFAFAICTPALAILQATNVTYAQYMLDRLTSAEKPFKIELMENVFTNDLGPNFYLGLGAGNFSSRSSLFLSGQYLADQMFVPIEPSQETQQHIMPYFNVHKSGMLNNGYDALSVVSEPFSQYTTILSEYGLLGLLIFLALFLYLLFSKYRISLEIKAITLLALSVFITNNWLEYPSFAAIFFLLFTCLYSHPPLKQARI
jgi:hypothetical protein